MSAAPPVLLPPELAAAVGPAHLPAGRWAIGVSGGADSVALLHLIRLARPDDVTPLVVHLNHQTRGPDSDADAAFVRALCDQLGVPCEVATLAEVIGEKGEPPLFHALFPAPAQDERAGCGSVGNPLHRGAPHPTSKAPAASSRGVRDSSRNTPSRPPLPLPQAKRGRSPFPPISRNPSARYRAARLAWFAACVRRHNLNGVLLAHHADDQAETILQRLARGSGPMGLCGMRPATTLNGLTLRRPLLGVRRAALRDWLAEWGGRSPRSRLNGSGANEANVEEATTAPTLLPLWREDASNDADVYQRNRVRRRLSADPALADALLDLGRACERLQAWVAAVAEGAGREPEAREHPMGGGGPSRHPGADGRECLPFNARPDDLPPLTPAAFAGLPTLVQRDLARRWLIAAGVPADRVEPIVVDRLLAMLADRATPARQTFPGRVRVRRRRGELYADAGGR